MTSTLVDAVELARMSWPFRDGWRLSQRGNLTIRLGCIQVTVFRQHEGFAAAIADLETGEVAFSHSPFRTVREAQFAAFDRLLALM